MKKYEYENEPIKQLIIGNKSIFFCKILEPTMQEQVLNEIPAELKDSNKVFPMAWLWGLRRAFHLPGLM